jgi:hypothetical protein
MPAITAPAPSDDMSSPKPCAPSFSTFFATSGYDDVEVEHEDAHDDEQREREGDRWRPRRVVERLGIPNALSPGRCCPRSRSLCLAGSRMPALRRPVIPRRRWPPLRRSWLGVAHWIGETGR